MLIDKNLLIRDQVEKLAFWWKSHKLEGTIETWSIEFLGWVGTVLLNEYKFCIISFDNREEGFVDEKDRIINIVSAAVRKLKTGIILTLLWLLIFSVGFYLHFLILYSPHSE